MERRDFLKSMGLGAAALALPGLGCASPNGGKNPNIIFVMADDLGYGDLGCYGQAVFRTPCLDQMAAEGMRFTDYYAGSTVCAPSRSCLLTGTHTGHTRIRGNISKVTGDRVPLLPEDLTVAELLKQAGYATGVIGKWGLGESGTTGIPNRKGFDYWYGYLNQRRAHNYYPDYLWRNEEKVILEGNVVEANVAIRQGKWKLVSYYNESHQFKIGKGERTGKWELYDLEADRTEMHNLAGKHPEKAAELQNLFEKWSKKVGVVPWETLEAINTKLQRKEQVF